jgi:hypothetical protein
VVESIWVESLGRNFAEALDLLEAAIRDCTDELWVSNMWEVLDTDAPDGVEDHALIQRYSTPWAIAWHALERLDFVLTGGFVPWEIWPPLAERLAAGTAAAEAPVDGARGHTGLDVLTLSPLWTRAEVLAYSDYCRQRVTDALADVTDEKAATLVGRGTYAWRLIRMALHVVEHASQIRQFITAAGVC